MAVGNASDNGNCVKTIVDVTLRFNFHGRQNQVEILFSTYKNIINYYIRVHFRPDPDPANPGSYLHLKNQLKHLNFFHIIHISSDI